MEKRFIVGIDLGTTNSSVAYVDLENKNAEGHQIYRFMIPQLTESGKFSFLSVLPSFLYIPGKYDISSDDMAVPWKIDQRSSQDRNFAGKFARDYGVKVPSRLVSSAKSWLCNKYVDKKARILPWGSSKDVFKISPVQASASYLKHIRKAWNISQGDNDALYLENQTVIITVPASFDEIARELTLESAKMAGLHNVLILEEPLAAFYNWISNNEKNWSEHVKPNQVILVCDVGGGTTDFTLIYLKEVNNKPRFERLAVGNHLILGGDNIDIAIAQKATEKLYKKTNEISNDDWNNLCYQCRKIKERILNGEVNSGRITIMGGGSNLISNTRMADIHFEDIERIIFDRFFPTTHNVDQHHKTSTNNFSTDGLPYEKNISITHHLENFIKQNQVEIGRVINKFKICPDLVLFNGGSLKSDLIQKRIVSFLENTFQHKTVVIKNQDMNLAVSMGAAYYGLVKVGHGLKIGSGSSRAFYIGVQQPSDSTSNRASKQAMCLVERGLEEGSTIVLPERQFEVLANQPVSIEIYSSGFRSGDQCGDIINVDNTLTTLPPIKTIIQFGEKEVYSKIPVNIEAKYTEVGTLELWCKSVPTPHRWQLKFQLRNDKVQLDINETEIFDDAKIQLALDTVKDVFSQESNNFALTTLTKTISKIVERNKHQWPLNMIRSLADIALEHMNVRNISSELESRWMNFIGFCLRPGLGEGFDPYRIKKLWKFYKQGPIHYSNLQVRSEWWIMWRRIAAGLNPGQQRQFIQDITPILLDKRNNKKPKQEKIEIWMTAANMEGLNVNDKIKIGRQLIEEITRRKAKPQLLWAISRLGARTPLYSSIDRVIEQEEVTKWIIRIISVRWRNPKQIIEVISHMAQMTGDRVRDIKPKLRNEINEWIDSFGRFPSHTERINKIVKISENQQKIIFGESIPSGIILKPENSSDKL